MVKSGRDDIDALGNFLAVRSHKLRTEEQTGLAISDNPHDQFRRPRIVGFVIVRYDLNSQRVESMRGSVGLT